VRPWQRAPSEAVEGVATFAKGDVTAGVVEEEGARPVSMVDMVVAGLDVAAAEDK
jgi:hypothetical protein